MPSAQEAAPTLKPGFVGGLNYDHPGGLVIKVGRVQIDAQDKDGKPIKRWVDGIDVAMYKDDPGVYYAANGRRLSEANAKDAGFDVEKMRKLRDRMLFMKDSAERFDAANAIAASRTVVASRDGIQVVDIGGGRHILEDAANADEPFNLTPGRHLTRDEAIRELARFFGDEPQPSASPQPAPQHVVGSVGTDGASPRPPEFRKVSK